MDQMPYRVIQSLGSPMLRQVVADFGRGELAQSAVRFEAVDYSLEEATVSVGGFSQPGEGLHLGAIYQGRPPIYN